jgi:MFS family permease
VESPLLKLQILTNPTFAIAMACLGLMAVAQYSRLVYIPLELGSVRGISEFQIGLAMLPSALCIAAMMPVGGRLVDRVGARIPVSLGVGLLAISFVGLWMLDIDTPIAVVAALLGLGGLGSGLAMMSPNVIAMNSVTASDVSQASGLSNVCRQISAAVGVAALASVFATVRPPGEIDPADPDVLDPYRTVYAIAVGLLVCALIVAQFLPGKRRALELQDERRREFDESAAGSLPIVHTADAH